LPYSLDTAVWIGGVGQLGAIGSDSKLGFFTGDNLVATFETAEARLNNQGRTLVTDVLPIIDNDNPTVTIRHRATQGASLTDSTDNATNSTTGEAQFFIDDRYHRVKITIPAAQSWNIAQGVKVRGEKSGEF